GRVLGEPAADGEADVGVSGLALPVVQAERVQTLAAAVARAAADMDLDADRRPGCERDALAGRDDVAAELVARHVWEARRRESAGEDLLVRRAHHRRAHAHQGLAA